MQKQSGKETHMVRDTIKNEWLTIKDKKVMCKNLAETLDEEEIMESVEPKEDARSFRLMCGYLKQGIEYYRYGDDHLFAPENDPEENEIPVLTRTDYPAALETLFCSIEDRFSVDLSAILEESEQKTQEQMIRDRAKAERNKELKKIVDSFGVDLESRFQEGTVAKVNAILNIQEAKRQSDAYQITEEEKKQEADATEIWCNILIRSMRSDRITCSIMRSLVDAGIVSEHHMEFFLYKVGVEPIFDWYVDDLQGQSQMDDTVLPVDLILRNTEPVFREILHF